MNADVRKLCGVSVTTANRMLSKLTLEGRVLNDCKEGHWEYKLYSVLLMH